MPPSFLAFWAAQKTAIAALRASKIALRDAALDIEDYTEALTQQQALFEVDEQAKALSQLAVVVRKRSL